jgi:hypothetical protein
MKKLIYLALVTVALGCVFTSCSNKLCPAYGSYHAKK